MAAESRRKVEVIVVADRPALGFVEGRRSRAYIVCMAPTTLVPAQLSDSDLIAEVARLAACERSATTALVALLAEMDARGLHLAEGCSSLFAYCTERLHLSDHAAYHRIQAARAATAFPIILEYLESGALTLTAVKLLGPHLTEDNHRGLLEAARFRSTREVEVMVRRFAPLPDVRSSVRKLPAPPAFQHRDATPSQTPAPRVDGGGVPSMTPAIVVPGPKPSPEEPERTATATRMVQGQPADGAAGHGPAIAAVARPADIRALSPERFSLRVTMSASAHAKLRRAQDLMRHTVPDGDPAAIVDRALTLLVEHLERTKFAAKKPPRGKTANSGGGRRDTTASQTGDHPKQADARGVSENRTASRETPCTTGRAPRDDGRVRRRSRHIPAAVKRAVWARDEGRCTFTGNGGQCRETGRLEYHHRLPVADGGTSTASNLELRCTAHHQGESELWFGYGDVSLAAALTTRRATS
jgi:5-methylcytosine-specific restriction endonuclease McrA